MMRPLLSQINEKNQYKFDKILEIYIKITIFNRNKKNLQNLYSETVFIKIKRILVIFERKRFLSNVKRLKKEFKELNIVLKPKLKRTQETENVVQRINLY